METQKYLEMIEGEYAERFSLLYDCLISYNARCNLTAITERGEVKIKHFLDSLTGEGFIPSNARVVEVGSGGGFPSLPLKIVRADLKFTLIESTGKKCDYLRQTADKLNLCEVEVKNIRAEEGGRDEKMRESFDVCVARAVARLNTLCEYCLPYVKVGGIFIAYKGAEDETKEAARAIKILGGELEKTVQFTLPDGSRRSLIIIKKVAKTPPKYPRGQGKERKSPL